MKAIFLLVAALVLAGCAPAAPREVNYFLAGTSESASISIRNGTGGNEQRDTAIPYRLDFTARRGAFLYLSAQNTDEAGGIVHCMIFVDGEVVSEARAEGRHHIATCSARAP